MLLSRECFNPFLTVVYEFLKCPECENMDLKIIQSLLGEGSNMQKMLDEATNECAGLGGLGVLSLTAQESGQTRDLRITITKHKKTVVEQTVVLVHFKKTHLLIIYSPPCHPRCPCLSFFTQKEIKVFDENITGFFPI